MPSMLSELRKCASPKKAELLSRFFKTGKGEYGEGDKFLGVMVPETRAVAKKFAPISIDELVPHLHSPWHEERLCSLLVLVEKFRKADSAERRKIFDFYFDNVRAVNNWDLVDLTAPKLVGEYFADKDRKPLYKLAKSSNIWERRIAIVSSFAFIRNSDLNDTFSLAESLLDDEHDLMHKACGWALREAGKKDKHALVEFLEKHKSEMPRTMLRYAIEKFSEKERKKFLRK